jgi:hypothetical protein
MMRNRLNWLSATAAAVLGAVVLSGCAATVRSYVDRTAQFAEYRTYAWAPPDRFTTGDPRLDNNTFFRDRLQTAADTQFAARGFEQAEMEGADLLLHYHVNVTQRIDVNEADQKYGYCDDCRAEVYDAGTLTLDLIDARTGRLVWRGWADRSIEGVLDQQEWMERQIDEAVVRILARLPRRL